MQISDVYVQSGAAEWAKRASTGDSFNHKNVNKETPKTDKTPSAKVSISVNAGNSAEALVKSRADALPEIREDKIAVVKERIGSGYYNTPEFSKELAARLVDD